MPTAGRQLVRKDERRNATVHAPRDFTEVKLHGEGRPLVCWLRHLRIGGVAAPICGDEYREPEGEGEARRPPCPACTVQPGPEKPDRPTSGHVACGEAGFVSPLVTATFCRVQGTNSCARPSPCDFRCRPTHRICRGHEWTSKQERIRTESPAIKAWQSLGWDTP